MKKIDIEKVKGDCYISILCGNHNLQDISNNINQPIGIVKSALTQIVEQNAEVYTREEDSVIEYHIE